MSLPSALDLPVACNLTALMQNFQRLVGREAHRYWCGGTISVTKLAPFMRKMQERYPILRNTRERSYDRHRGRAVVHMIVFPIWDRSSTPAVHGSGTWTVRDGIMASRMERPTSESRVGWWLISGAGSGGLLDPAMPDARVAQDAMSASGHIVVGDYVLVYASKKEPRTIVDTRTGRSRRIFKDTSTWTWRTRSEILKQVRASIDDCCVRIEYGAERGADSAGCGLRGLLAAQRARPLFSGIRNQVIDLHKYARDTWGAHRPRWAAAHPELAAEHRSDAGALRPIADVIANCLPRMVRIRAYDDPPLRVRDLL